MLENKEKFLFLFKTSESKIANKAYYQARKLKLIVPTRYAKVGMVVQGPKSKIDQLFKTGNFLLVTSKEISSKSISDFSERQKEVAQQWNYQFSKVHLMREEAWKSRIESGVKETEKDLPPYYSKIDPHLFIQKVNEIAKAKKLAPIKESFEELLELRKIDFKKGGKRILIRWVKKYYGKRYRFYYSGIIYRLAYHHSRCFLHADWDEVVYEAARELEFLTPAPSCRKLHGQIAVGIVFVNSSLPGGPVVTGSEQAALVSDISAGLGWLTTEHPSGNLGFVFESRIANINVDDQPNNTDDVSSTFDAYWRNPGIGALGFSSDSNGIDAYKSDLITRFDTDDSVVFFVTKYGSSWHAYSSGERFISLSRYTSSWSNGPRNFTGTAPHELLHQFGAADEYDATVASCDGNCDELHGCDNIPNGNCITCANPYRSCLMKSSYIQKICQYTRGQIGWADIFVEITTDDEANSGTRDQVFLDIGHKTYELDVPDVRDRKKTYKEGYAIFDGGDLSRNQIKRILLRKEGGNNDWKLEDIKVFHDGEIICEETPRKWFRKFEPFHLVCDLGTGRQIVHKLELRVKTADEANAGTDSKVTLTLAGEEWRIESTTNDFGRGLNQVYNLDPRTGLRISDLTEIRISKSSSAIGGGAWKLEGLELIINDQTIYENNDVDTWLNNNNLTYTEAMSPPVSI